MSLPAIASWRHPLVAILAAFGMGCATVAMDTETDCIQRHPGLPEACGLTASEAAAIMAAGMGATGSHTGSKAEEYDDSHNAHLPDWKRRCIRLYGDCQTQAWTRKASCFACFESCTGQHEWPFDKCQPKAGQ
ncbi:hypothetical protein HNS30_06145 [Corallococcus exercitus]|uniref:Lipoprotein n=2 Tax=Corallococcus exercitus TaxID=2316736 RepID=A0A7Y4JP62_9BACT|nr:hypothetical protein [Corallococcus exercitus]